MGRYFALTIDLPSAIQTSKQIRRGRNASGQAKTKSNLWIGVLLIIIGIVYLVQVNSLSTKGYEIKKLEAKLLELKESHARLELEAAALKSIQNLEAIVKTLNLVPSGGVNYLKGLSGYAYEE